MPSIQHEYYIRQPDDAEARGPFTLAQLSSLAGSGGLDARTLYFDANGEQWLPVAGDAELGILLRDASASAPAPARANANVSTPTPTQTQTPTQAFAVKAARVLLFASAAVLLLAAVAVMATTPGGKMRALLSQPFFWLGVIDVFLGACAGFLMRRNHLALIIRLRAAAGVGLLGVFFWLMAAIPALVFVVIASACLWLATVFGSRRALLINAIAGLAALAGFASCMLS